MGTRRKQRQFESLGAVAFASAPPRGGVSAGDPVAQAGEKLRCRLIGWVLLYQTALERRFQNRLTKGSNRYQNSSLERLHVLAARKIILKQFHNSFGFSNRRRSGIGARLREAPEMPC